MCCVRGERGRSERARERQDKTGLTGRPRVKRTDEPWVAPLPWSLTGWTVHRDTRAGTITSPPAPVGSLVGVFCFFSLFFRNFFRIPTYLTYFLLNTPIYLSLLLLVYFSHCHQPALPCVLSRVYQCVYVVRCTYCTLAGRIHGGCCDGWDTGWVVSGLTWSDPDLWFGRVAASASASASMRE